MNCVASRPRLTLSRLASLALLIVALCSSARANDPRQDDKDSLSTRVDEVFAQWDKRDSPGCALAVIKDGHLLFKRGYGMANLEHDIPITTTSVMDVASVSKQFTAMCILLLAEQGKVSLDDDIRKYLPEMHRYESPITIRHLIHHTSGLREYMTLMRMTGMREDDFYTEAEALDLLARQKQLNFKPGDQYLYSNSGYFLLGQIVKRASGKTLREFADQHIFKPLGMKNTHFNDDHDEVVRNRATGYAPKANGFQISSSTLDLVGDGNVVTTVEDLFLWDQNFYQNKLGKGDQNLVNKALTSMTLNGGEKIDYAFGLMVSHYRGLKIVEHGGSFVGYKAYTLRFPDQRFSVICQCNLSTIVPGLLSRRVADIYLADQFKQGAAKDAAPQPAKDAAPPAAPKFIEVSEAELKDKLRAYRNPSTGIILSLYLKDGKLTVDGRGVTAQFSPISATEFLAVNGPDNLMLKFEKQAADKPMRLYISEGGGKPQVLEEVRLVPLTAEQLAAYAGDFYSDELRVTYTIVVENQKLYIRHENRQKDFAKNCLEPKYTAQGEAVRDSFAISGGRDTIGINFIRNGQNRPHAFTMNMGRVRNISFARR